MSVGNTNFQNTYTTDGTAGPWAFNWIYTEEIQVQVYLDLVLQSPSTYTVTKDLVSPGGTISFNAGSVPILGKALLIQRFSNTLQTDTLGTNQELPPATLVRMADKLTIIAQQLSAQILRSLALPLTSIGVSAALPTPVAGAIPVWNAAANAIEYILPTTAGLALLDRGVGLPPAYGAVTSAAGGNVIGPGSSAVGNVPIFNSLTGTVLADSGVSVAGLGVWVNAAAKSGTWINDTAGSNVAYPVDATSATICNLVAATGSGKVSRFAITTGSGGLTINRDGSDTIDYLGTSTTNITMTGTRSGVLDLLDVAAGLWRVV
jgi:hypothetical protein